MTRRGGVMVITGPDGTGKSSVCAELERGVLADREVLRLHHRPTLLPSREAGDVTAPHNERPYPRLLGAAKLVYLYLDFLLGWAFKVRPAVSRGAWVILERGWWDLEVDPLRYRLREVGWLVRALGRRVPRPDLFVALEAPPEVLLTRKKELSADEIVRQQAAWRRVVPPTYEPAFIDASQPLATVVDRIAAMIKTADAPVPPGQRWTSLPRGGAPRIFVPRAPPAAAHQGLSLFNPMTPRGHVGWQAARALARAGGARVVGSAHSPPAGVLDRIGDLVPEGGSVAVAATNHRDRWVALVLGPQHEPTLVVKVALTDEAGAPIDREADALADLAPHLSAPLRAPVVVAQGPGWLALEAVDRRVRRRPWMLPTGVAGALGHFWAAGRTPGSECGNGHGDVAPWNLLADRDGAWVLIDWESARDHSPAFEDVWHYLVQAHALLGRPSRDEVLAGVDGSGLVAHALRAYALAADLDPAGARIALGPYLERSRAGLDPAARDGQIGLEARSRLLAEIGH